MNSFCSDFTSWISSLFLTQFQHYIFSSFVRSVKCEYIHNLLVLIIFFLGKVSIVNEPPSIFYWLSYCENWLSLPKLVTGVFSNLSYKEVSCDSMLLRWLPQGLIWVVIAFHLHSWTLPISLSILVLSNQRSLLHLSTTIYFLYSPFLLHINTQSLHQREYE